MRTMERARRHRVQKRNRNQSLLKSRKRRKRRRSTSGGSKRRQMTLKAMAQRNGIPCSIQASCSRQHTFPYPQLSRSCTMVSKGTVARSFSQQNIGKPVDLPPESEEVAGFFAAMLDTDHAKNETFQANFF